MEPKAKGVKLRRYNWLCIPLCPFHHHILDSGVEKFEIAYGTQAVFIDKLCEIFSIDLWALAKQGKK